MNETDINDFITCQPWTTRISKMAQPNLDFMRKYTTAANTRDLSHYVHKCKTLSHHGNFPQYFKSTKCPNVSLVKVINCLFFSFFFSFVWFSFSSASSSSFSFFFQQHLKHNYIRNVVFSVTCFL